MLQALLADRFSLKIQRTQRKMPIFALRLARSDGRLGPNLRQAPPGCDGASSKERSNLVAPKGGAVAGGSCAPIAAVAGIASTNLRFPVLDRTGLTGMWAFAIYYAPDSQIPAGRPTDPNLASFVTALPEQLGLKLERENGLVDVLVIESIEPPTDN
jgi:uncharacterized protein (TIGR03435 family)